MHRDRRTVIHQLLVRRSTIAVAALVCLGLPALVWLGCRNRPARVLEKRETIVVNETTGRWHHDYVVRVTIAAGDVSSTRRDTLSLAVGRNQYDGVRFGSRVSIGTIAFAPGIAWLRDTMSARGTLKAAIDARRTISRDPAPVSPLDAPAAGLARVIRMHRIALPRNGLSPSSRSTAGVGWIELVEVEFWAQQARALVRTIDVIDAASIPNLQAGDIVQMHYDPREPRTLRLDDGRRTFGRETEP